jgi:transcriptional regulator with XRE-family HTH domain
MPLSPIGRRIRTVRERQGRPQAAIAGLCGITADYLSRIERGLKTPSVEVLHALARELAVPVAEFLGEDESGLRTVPAIAPAIARALLGFGAAVDTQEASPPAVLRDRVEGAWNMWQSAPDRFSRAAEVLPPLVVDVENALRFYRAPGDSASHRELLRCSADLYGLLRSYCRRVGRPDLSLMVADRALRAAEEANDLVRIATAHWNLGHILLGDQQFEEAEQVARRGAERIKQAPASRETEAMRGALGLVTAVSLTRRRKWWDAREQLERVEPIANEVRETNVGRTAFGPTNVRLYRLGTEMEAGETVEALSVADQIDLSHVPSAERRFQFGLDIARCYEQRREDTAVLLHLLDVEEFAPEDLARTPDAQRMILRLVEQVRPTYRRQAVALAERIGVL